MSWSARLGRALLRQLTTINFSGRFRGIDDREDNGLRLRIKRLTPS
jgi:hypothetical protein